MYRPSEDQIMAMAQRTLQARMAHDGVRIDLPHTQPWRSPSADRRKRSLQSCHRFTLDEPGRAPPPKDTGAYVPELAGRLEDDRNLTDGARRCARKLAEYTYRRNREGRSARITVTYLSKALNRSRRTVQRYLRQLERAGYISVGVVRAQTRMCAGLVVELLTPLFPRHHAQKWPARLIKPGAPLESQNKKSDIIAREFWALHCMEGVWRSFNRAYPPGSLLPR
jgi:hypothetical protein